MPRPSSSDRIAQLEAAVAALEDQLTAGRKAPPTRRHRPHAVIRVVAGALALALIIPAGIALASHRFNDVPTGHQFHADIAAIADAGITSGCPQGTNNYCPNGLVTRGQMAAFMNRLGALSPGKAPKVNADRVDGRHANQLIRVAEMDTGATTTIPTGGTKVQYGPNLTITAPTAGFVAVNIGVTLRNSGCTTSFQCYVDVSVRHVESDTDSFPQTGSPSSPELYDAISVHAVFPVQAGVNRFALELARAGTTGTIQGWFASGTALFTPFGSTGSSTLSVDAGSTQEVDRDKQPGS